MSAPPAAAAAPVSIAGISAEEVTHLRCFVAAHKPALAVLVAGRDLSPSCAQSLTDTTFLCAQLGIPVYPIFLHSETLSPRALFHYLVARGLAAAGPSAETPRFTHFWHVHARWGWNAAALLEMIGSGLDFVAAPSCGSQLNLRQLFNHPLNLFETSPDGQLLHRRPPHDVEPRGAAAAEQLSAHLLSYSMMPQRTPQNHYVTHGDYPYLRCDYVTLDALLMRRSALEDLGTRVPAAADEFQLLRPGEQGFLRDYFAFVEQDDLGRVSINEHRRFCSLARKAGFALWLNPKMVLTGHLVQPVRTRLMDLIMEPEVYKQFYGARIAPGAELVYPPDAAATPAPASGDAPPPSSTP